MIFHALLLAGLPLTILGFGIQLEGLIDLGPQWNYKYKFYQTGSQRFDDIPTYLEGEKGIEDPNISEDKHVNMKLTDLHHEHNTVDINLTVDPEITKTVTENVRSQTKLADDGVETRSEKDFKNDKDKLKVKLREFIKHVIEQALKVFDDIIKRADNDKFKNKIKEMKNNYVEKFGDFVKRSQDHKLKTRLGLQKFILNTIDTSNRIMQSLVNVLSKNENLGRSLNILQEQIDKEKQLGYDYVCNELGVCRNRKDFADLLIEIIDIVLQTDNFKVQQAANALTEALKWSDFTATIDEDTQKKLRKFINRIELWSPYELRAMFFIIRNVLIHRNEPLIINYAEDRPLANKTVAFLEIIDTLNKNILLSDNSTKFDEIVMKLSAWRDGTGKEVQSAFESLVEMIKKASDELDPRTAEVINNNLIILLKPLKSFYINKKNK